MHALAIPFTFFEIFVFAVAVVAFLLAVRFFIASQRRLEGLLPNSRRNTTPFNIGIDRDGFLVPTTRPQKREAFQQDHRADEEARQEIKELRNMLQLQQLELSRAMRQMETISTTDKEENKEEERYAEDDDYVTTENHHSTEDLLIIDDLQRQLVRKEAEMSELRQQAELNQKLQSHFEEVQTGYEELQQKVHKMEQQAWQAAELAMKVDSLEQAAEQAEKMVQKKEEKVRELSVENGRLHEQLSQTEDKLSEANFQRQQLLKKIQFLEELASDMHQMTDANRKLKTELRRVAELESMLNLITEERDALLKRKKY